MESSGGTPTLFWAVCAAFDLEFEAIQKVHWGFVCMNRSGFSGELARRVARTAIRPRRKISGGVVCDQSCTAICSAAVDQPLSVVRFGYRSVMGQNNDAQPAYDWWPFAIFPLWTVQGRVERGVFEDGGIHKCTTISGVTRCIWRGWPAELYAYDRDRFRRVSWHGSVVEDKRDAAGTHYRRNRHYDPQSGRFTQEDPIGLAGGMNLYGYAGGGSRELLGPVRALPHVLRGLRGRREHL